MGVESEHGARFVERMLLLAGTARKQGINLLEWLTQALKPASEENQPPASRLSEGTGLNGYVWSIRVGYVIHRAKGVPHSPRSQFLL